MNSWPDSSERLNGIQWSWVQIPLRPTFYSYFKESFGGEYHKYTYIYKYTVLYIWVFLLFSRYFAGIGIFPGYFLSMPLAKILK